jgi:hypothetical protein
MSTRVGAYALDTTGQALANKITNDNHSLSFGAGSQYLFVVPKESPFYEVGLVIRHTPTTGPTVVLTKGVDYNLAFKFIGASSAITKPVYGGISFVNTALTGSVSLDYQALGGNYSVDTQTLTSILSDELRNPLIVSWEDVAGVPTVFPPTPHAWQLNDLVGLTALVEKIDLIASNVSAKPDTPEFINVSRYGNPSQVGLGNLSNFKSGTLQEHLAGLKNDRFAVIGYLKNYIQSVIQETGVSDAILQMLASNAGSSLIGTSTGLKLDRAALVYDTALNLKNVLPTAQNNYALTLGFAQVDDSASSVYRWSATELGENNYSVIRPSAIGYTQPGRWVSTAVLPRVIAVDMNVYTDAITPTAYNYDVMYGVETLGNAPIITAPYTSNVNTSFTLTNLDVNTITALKPVGVLYKLKDSIDVSNPSLATLSNLVVSKIYTLLPDDLTVDILSRLDVVVENTNHPDGGYIVTPGSLSVVVNAAGKNILVIDNKCSYKPTSDIETVDTGTFKLNCSFIVRIDSKNLKQESRYSQATPILVTKSGTWSNLVTTVDVDLYSGFGLYATAVQTSPAYTYYIPRKYISVKDKDGLGSEVTVDIQSWASSVGVPIGVTNLNVSVFNDHLYTAKSLPTAHAQYSKLSVESIAASEINSTTLGALSRVVNVETLKNYTTLKLSEIQTYLSGLTPTDVSSTTKGVVNNVLLQELGGVDKTINGVRIGRGQGNLPSNTVLGAGALASNTTGYNNVAIGKSSLLSNSTGSRNVVIGPDGLYYNTVGYENVSISGALFSNTSGYRNIGIGTSTLSYNTIGYDNVAIGPEAVYAGVVSRTIAIGRRAMYNTTSGNGNVSIGCDSLWANTTGSNNTAIGSSSGSNNTIGSNNITIGSNAQTSTNTISNEVTIGNTSITNTRIRGALSVGNTTPDPGVNGQVLTSKGPLVEPVWLTPSSGATNIDGLSDAIFDTALGNMFLGRTIGGTTGTNNTSVGTFSSATLTTGVQNTSVGYSSLRNTTAGSYNTAIGQNALYVNTTGSANTAIGTATLVNNTTGSNNTAIGFQALFSNTGSNNNTAIGYNSLWSSTTGYNNTAIGFNSLYANTTGYSNVAIGINSLKNNTIGNYNVAIGDSCLTNNVSGAYNLAIGISILNSNTTGSSNLAVGTNSLNSNINGNNNTAIGYSALRNSKGSSNGVAIGYESQLFANDTVSQLTNYNTSVGYCALRGGPTPANNTGYYNTAIGYNSLYANTSGSHNVAIGVYSLNSNTTGSSNIAVGTNSLYANTTGYSNVAIGQNALNLNTDGNSNTAIGHETLLNNLGSGNTALGYSALRKNTTGWYNVAVGQSTMYWNTTGNNNVAVGRSALNSNTTGSYNTANGDNALASNTTGQYSVAVGGNCLLSNTTGIGNTAVGTNASSGTTTGSYNTSIGYQALRLNYVGSNNIAIGNDAQSSTTTVSNEITLGNSSITSLRCNVQSISSLSDERDKCDWDYAVPGIEFIRDLKPGYFTWQRRDGTFKGVKAAGFGAQSLLEVQNKHKATNLDLVYDGNPERLEARYSNLIVPMVKSIIDLDKENVILKEKLSLHDKEILELRNLIKRLTEKVFV